MALFGASDFVGFAEMVPVNAGVSGTGNILSLIMSDGTTTQIFTDKAVGRRMQTWMISKHMYMMNPTDDIIILSVGPKLIVMESTFMNQKLINSYVAVYIGGEVRWVSRSLSNSLNTTDAYLSVGLNKQGGSDFLNNYDLETNLADSHRPRMQIFDYYFENGVSDSNTGTLLVDPTSIHIDITAP